MTEFAQDPPISKRARERHRDRSRWHEVDASTSGYTGQASRSGWMDAWQWVRKPRNEVDFVGSSLEPAVAFEQYEGYAMLSTELLLDEDDLFTDGYDRSVLKFEYWPDALAMPELVIGAVGSGINYQLGMD